jgi:2,4-dienoyl-CoA reductase-like NADH-dependent reductase (Old Yellow Enzyme family)
MTTHEVDTARWRILLQGLRVGPVELPNRLVFGPHCPVFVDALGRPTEQFAAYFAERARGGAGLVIIGVSTVDRGGALFPVIGPAMFDDRVIEGLQRTAEAVHEAGSRLFIQLIHPGVQGSANWLRDPVAGDPDGRFTTVGPSAVPSPSNPGAITQELTEYEIWTLIDGFADAARRAQAAGLDGVEINAAVGFLVEQFLSPFYNHRADRWGGSLQNRARFLLEVLKATRCAVADRLAIGVRLTMDEQLPGGYGIDEALRVVGLLEEQHIYDYLNTCLGQAFTPHIHIASLYTPEAFERELVAKIRVAASRPVFITNRISSPMQAGDLIADGVADAVSMVRPLIADPESLRKAAAGRIDEIRPCLYCNQWCIGNVLQGMKVSCVVNPRAGRESLLALPIPAAQPRRVLIVGSGPAGLKAAEQLADRGHAVVLCEAAGVLGGAVRLAARLPGRGRIAAAVDHLIGRIERLSVEIRLDTTLDCDRALSLIATERFDDVIVATGADRATSGWNGATGAVVAGAAASPLVLSVDEVILGRRPLGRRVLVVDEPGDIVAAGIAELLGSEGFVVELVTRWPTIAPQVVSWGMAGDILPRLHAAGVRLATSLLVTEITGQGVQLLDPTTLHETRRDVDSLVLVGAPRGNSWLYDQLTPFAATAPWALHRIGDAIVPRSIGEAILEGEQIARRLTRAPSAGEAVVKLGVDTRSRNVLPDDVGRPDLPRTALREGHSADALAWETTPADSVRKPARTGAYGRVNGR